jgi:hypothetical protein
MMEHFGLQSEQTLVTEPSLSFADSPQTLSFQGDAALDPGYGLLDNLLEQFRETIRYYRTTSRRRMRLLWASQSPSILLMKVLWASPWSFWGLSVGTLGMVTGARVRRSGRILEFWGGLLPLFLKYFPFVAGSPVATFGHVVVGRTDRHLDACRAHQLIHVQQYERWGLLFVPVYIGCSGYMWCCGKRPYYDNPFEREAFTKAP